MAEKLLGSPTDLPKFTELNDLASELVGGGIIFATDDWFAPAENMLLSRDAEFKDGVFTEFGKWMDGWETRRKRTPGHDWCIIKLGAAGVLAGVNVDTSYFTGNFAPRVSLQAACLHQDIAVRSGQRMGTRADDSELAEIEQLKSEDWETILERTELRPGYRETCHNYFEIRSKKRWTHIRFNLFPDGGVARLRVFGQVVRDWALTQHDGLIDLAAMLNGGISVGYSNAHYGHARNVISPGRARVMAEGWETARRLDRPAVLTTDDQGILQIPGHEWAEFKLGHPGIISKIEIDTNHFKGNFPDSCYIEACYEPDCGKPSGPWHTLLAPKKLSAHRQHYYEGEEIIRNDAISHVRLVIVPDGGISRMRLWGHISEADMGRT